MTRAEKLQKIAENEQRVYNAGYEKGKSESGDSYYDALWDGLQAYGTRTDYSHGFNAQFIPISSVAFKPKYDMRPTNAHQMFKFLFNAEFSHPESGADFVALFGERVLDLSKAVDARYLFYHARVSRVGIIDCSSVNSLIYGFTDSRIETIEKLVLTKNITNFGNCFNAAEKLKNITVEGVIAASVNFQWSPLTVASMKSIISALSDLTGTDNAYVYTIKFSSDCWAALDADGNTAPHGGTWKDYVDTVLCWGT